MNVKVPLSDVYVGSCFVQGKNLKKKVGDDQVLSKKKGKVSIRKQKGDPQVTPVTCPLGMLGLGMPNHPEMIVEIGDGNPLRRRRP